MGNDKEVIVPKEVVVIGEGAFEGNKIMLSKLVSRQHERPLSFLSEPL